MTNAKSCNTPINVGEKLSKATEESICADPEKYQSAAGDIDDRKSTSGYLFKFTGASISWRSRKQSCVALSTAEAEYTSLATAGQEAIWLSRLITELKRGTENPVTLYEDNQAAICLSKNPQFHWRSKHIAIKYHFIRDQVQKGTLTIQYCKTEAMAADMMTKELYSD
uniref:Reverse transcriptase Ty1/copia-type domain-containing protein n=1 Tax=Amphimedon queenslandica TaxID=400682 RepID=A0A1X7UD26_AMPQE